VTTRDDAIPLSELFAYLLSQESRIESRRTTPKTDEYSTNFANRGRGKAPIRGRVRGGHFSPTGRRGNVNNSSSRTLGGSSGKKNPCQICGKLGHNASIDMIRSLKKNTVQMLRLQATMLIPPGMQTPGQQIISLMIWRRWL
jgi:hypothetical protein